ncbi:MAG: hypothetical protein OEZ15_09410, partial [Gammaproteobacteria bacterium]|nr:hypothetical protein [Gammaproteobacteria bacterium]
SFSVQVDENIGSIGNPQLIPGDGSVQQHGMNSAIGTNYYSTDGLTPNEVYSIKLNGFSVTGDMDLALTDSAGTTISCDVLAVVPNGVAEECQFTAGATGTANFKVSYAAGTVQESYDISIGTIAAPVVLVAEGSIATPVTLVLGSPELPYAGMVDSTWSYYEVTGLTAGSTYDVSASGVSADVDLYVYLTDSTYGATTWDCRPWTFGIVDEACTVVATGTSMWIAIDGTYSGPGATFTLGVQ